MQIKMAFANSSSISFFPEKKNTMLYEQYQSLGLPCPSIDDGGVSKLNSSLSSLDFYLLDDIDTYLPSLHSEKPKIDLINDSINDNSVYQLPDDFFSDIDLSDLTQFSEISEEIDIEKWISEASFPSPQMDATNSCDSLFNEQYPINTDMIVPAASPPSLSSSSSSSLPSPSSSISSSPGPSLKRTKLSTIERKLRKKDQNKTAAEKYRFKKKSERTELLDRQAKLKRINKELKSELEDLSYRVQKFKQLFAEFVQPN